MSSSGSFDFLQHSMPRTLDDFLLCFPLRSEPLALSSFFLLPLLVRQKICIHFRILYTLFHPFYLHHFVPSFISTAVQIKRQRPDLFCLSLLLLLFPFRLLLLRPLDSQNTINERVNSPTDLLCNHTSTVTKRTALPPTRSCGSAGPPAFSETLQLLRVPLFGATHR